MKRSNAYLYVSLLLAMHTCVICLIGTLYKKRFLHQDIHESGKNSVIWFAKAPYHNKSQLELVLDQRIKVTLNEKYQIRATHNNITADHLVTLFTTFRTSTVRQLIHLNTIINWALLPGVTPVLFSDSLEAGSQLEGLAVLLGWVIERRYRKREGVPVIRDMFQRATQKYPAPYIAMANADILFDTSLVTTLSQIKCNYPTLLTHPMLITGRRRNIPESKFSSNASPSHIECVSHKTSRFTGLAQDYFITHGHGGFPWDMVPDFVIGRVGYDNWLVSQSLVWNVTLIDASDTVNAVHQVGQDGVSSGRTLNKGKQRRLNLALVPGYRYSSGTTYCAPFKTIRTSDTCTPCYLDNETRCFNLSVKKRTQGKRCNREKAIKKKYDGA